MSHWGPSGGFDCGGGEGGREGRGGGRAAGEKGRGGGAGAGLESMLLRGTSWVGVGLSTLGGRSLHEEGAWQ